MSFETLDLEYAARVGCEPLGPPPAPLARGSVKFPGGPVARRRAQWCAETYHKRLSAACRLTGGRPIFVGWPEAADLPDFIRHGAHPNP